MIGQNRRTMKQKTMFSSLGKFLAAICLLSGIAWKLKKRTHIRKGMKIVFLLGSGISISAGMKGTDEITRQVLSGDNVRRHTAGCYEFGKPLYAHMGFQDEYVPKITAFLRVLKGEIDQYFVSNFGRDSNYEDLYYVVDQMDDGISGDLDNPVIQPFTDSLLAKIQSILEEISLQEILSETKKYIHDVVWRLLNTEPSSTDYLRTLKEACFDAKLSAIDIFTLNHDVVLERLLEKSRIQFTDGFGKKETDDIRYWKPELFQSGTSKVRLFKLHGSVNWFRFRPDGGGWEDELIGSVPLNCEIEYARNPAGKTQRAIEGRPRLLLGTFNKMLKYTSGIYIELFCQFYNSLRQSKFLVICGYGFGDKGINTQVLEWVYSSLENRIVIIHGNVDQFMKRARPALSTNWKDLVGRKKLIVIPKWIENVSWSFIKKELL
jgi:hypothetical protein